MTATTVDAIDMNVVHELKMSAPDMGWMAKALLAAAARDEVYGVRCHAHLTADGLTATAAASDGYRIHQLHLPLRSPVDAVEITVPRDALVWAAKNVRTFTPKKDSLIEPVAVLLIVIPAPSEHKHPGWVSMIYREWDDDAAPSARFDAPLIADEFPPLGRLVDKVRQTGSAAPTPLNLDLLADARTLATPLTTTPTIEYTSGSGGRPGPALLDFWEESVLRGTAVIQPMRTEGDEG